MGHISLSKIHKIYCIPLQQCKYEYSILTFTYLLAYLLSYLPTTYLPIFLISYYLLTYLLSYILTYLLITYLITYLLTYYFLTLLLITYLLIYLLNYLLTSRNRVLLQKLTRSQLVKKFPAFMELEGSLPHSQEPATCPFPGPDHSSQ